MLTLYTSNRLEILADALAEIIGNQPPSPLETEIIVVQSKGMARWLAMELAERLGIWANCSYPFPNAFVWDIFRLVKPEIPERSAVDREINTWRLMGLLPDLFDHPDFREIRDYLRGKSILKRLHLAGRLADLFDQYLIYRPDLLLAWEKGRNDGWQSELWRRLAALGDEPHGAVLLDNCLAGLSSPIDSKMPDRITVFGISSLPPFHLRTIQAVSRHCEVNFFLLNPCMEYWDDIASGREIAGITRRKVRPANELYLEQGNRLLASLGLLGRDFLTMLHELDCREKELFVDPEGPSLLSSLQADILHLREGGPEGGIITVAADDRSVQIHSCHSPMREVEVLRDHLLALFDRHQDLQPRDVIVMTPDIEVYAPLIKAVFDVGFDDRLYIPYTVADRSIRRETRLIEVFLGVLDLIDGRFTANGVLNILETEQVRNKFNISESDLELLKQWVGAVRINWGIDQDSRAGLGLPASGENTWQAGIDRLLLGYAMRGREKLFKGVLPFDGLEGGDCAALSRFLDFWETLGRYGQLLKQKYSLNGWTKLLLAMLDDLFSGADEGDNEQTWPRAVLVKLGELENVCGFHEKIGLDVIRDYLKQNIDRRTSPYGFMGGGLTFCSMLPMRAIPFKVICVLGMNDTSFPRSNISLNFDFMMKAPRRGDRSRRLDDRYLFLEALISARQQLYISYVGQSAKDNGKLPPSVVVSELIDYLSANTNIDPDLLPVRHRLQAFDPEYFLAGGQLFSYSRPNLEAARRLIAAAAPRPPFFPKALRPADGVDRVDLEDLCRFFSHPARFLCQTRLGLFFTERRTVLEDSEPFAIEALARYRLQNKLVDRRLGGRDLSEYFQVERAAGELPHGRMGEVSYRQLSREAEVFSKRVSEYRIEMYAPFSLELQVDGTVLTGRIAGVAKTGLVLFRCAKIKAADLIRLWINHLVINAGGPDDFPKTGILLGRDMGFRFPPVRHARDILAELLGRFRQGLTAPLPFFPASSLKYAEALKRGRGEAKALAGARGTWLGSDFSQGEGEDPYYQLCYQDIDPMDDHFKGLALEFFEPLLQCRERL